MCLKKTGKKHPYSQVNESQNTKRHPIFENELTWVGLHFILYKNAFF